ncbi:MAG: hypothetical protein GY868_19750 [Deltaproteobacteria bacterium]|nr:hypothetical protein [Deltaproteobacteria bacterium]
MNLEKTATRIFKTNNILRPVCFTAFIIILWLNLKTGLSSAFIVAFSLLTFIDGYLSLRFSKPSLTIGIRKIQETDISSAEKTKRAAMLTRWHKFLSFCGIAGSIILPFFWFYII